jgi:hypothetical protein
VIAALFVERGGVYFGLPNVDPWDESRDARLYAGPWPVVAHPPCQRWTNLAAVNFKRYGGEYNRPGNDGGCFEAALRSVWEYGGVLEHPAFSRAWFHYGLGEPTRSPCWQFSGSIFNICHAHWRAYVTEVWQSAYGHRARKRTWLYAVTSGERPGPIDWSRKPGVAQCGWFDRIKPTLSKREASATPPAFRDLLIAIAENAVSNAREADHA